jgi:hypothetical protein
MALVVAPMPPSFLHGKATTWLSLAVAYEMHHSDVWRLSFPSPTEQDANGKVPLHYSTALPGTRVRLAATKMLLEAGAKPNVVDQQGLTPLMAPIMRSVPVPLARVPTQPMCVRVRVRMRIHQ